MRYFPNNLADFVPGTRVDTIRMVEGRNYWKGVILKLIKTINDKMPPTFENCDGGLYVGSVGIAYMYQYLANNPLFVDIRQELLTKARNYTDVALSYAISKQCRDPPSSFLLGSAGAFAVGSLVYNDINQKEASVELNKKYLALSSMLMPVHALSSGSDELFVGRAGYLCGSLLLNRKFGEYQVVNEQAIHSICKSIMHSGLEYSKKHQSPSPLMFTYYHTEYLGAAHGLSAILQMLLHFPSFYKSNSDIETNIHSAVDFMLGLMGANGNIPATMGDQKSLEDDELVHWCHGGPGIVYLFARAFLVWKDAKYLQACLKCGELTWQKGLLKKGPGICHGVAGSGYVFLLLYRLTSDEKHLHRALKFAEFLMTREFEEGSSTPDTPYSLYEGWAGTVCYLADLLQPQKAEFPFFDVYQ